MDIIEIIDPVFKDYVLPNAELEKLGDGFRWLEGPVWFADLECLLVSDLPSDRVLRWTEKSGISVFKEPSGFANGHTRDRQGRLISCSHKDRRITRTELNGSVTVLASHYGDKRLNSPNDVIVRRDGTIWFTDPIYGISTDFEGGKQTPELPPSLYCLVPEGELSVVSTSLVGPNGLCFSPDESILYVSDSGEQFAVEPEHSVRLFEIPRALNGRVSDAFFYRAKQGHADGLRCDEHGNLWIAAGDGVHCVDPTGRLIGKIKMPFTVSNLTFGGRNRSQLFLCASHTLYSLFVNVRGPEFP